MKTLPKIERKIITGVQVSVDENGMIFLPDLHKAAKNSEFPVNRKTAADWLRTKTSKEFIEQLKIEKLETQICVTKTTKGRGKTGTWAHELIAIEYARWLNPKFAIQVNKVFLRVCRGDLEGASKIARDDAAQKFKPMNDALVNMRSRQGKGTQARHFNNESGLIALAVTGYSPKVLKTMLGHDWRTQLDSDFLSEIAKAEETNTNLLNSDVFDYALRKSHLSNLFSNTKERFKSAYKVNQ